MKHHQLRSICVQLLIPIWSAVLLVSCVSNPATRVSQASELEPSEPAAVGTPEPAATELSSLDEYTALPEEEVYWPTEAWRVAAPDEKGMDAASLGQMLARIDAQNLNFDSVVVVCGCREIGFL